MDWLRSCYQSEWLLFRDDPARAVPGRYYFSPPDTPFFPGEHRLGARVWLDGNLSLEQGIGEDLEARHQWDRGDRPGAVPYAKTVGTVDCIANGDRIADAIPIFQSWDGWPEDCFRLALPVEQDLWGTATSFNNCSVQFFYASVIQLLYQSQFADAETAIHLFLGTDAQCFFHQVAGNLPSWVVVRKSNFALVIASGTDNFQQLALQGFYSLTGPTNYGALATNAIWYDCATAIHASINAAHVPPTQRIAFVGHSYGGAACAVALVRYGLWNRDRQMRFLSFGDPKPGDDRVQAELHRHPCTSIANDGDFITIMPPDADSIWAALGLLTSAQIIQLLRWQSEPGRFLQLDDGTLLAGEPTAIGVATVLSYVGSALLGNPVAVVINHEINVYRSRIRLRCPTGGFPVSPSLWLFLLGIRVPDYFGNDFWGEDYFGTDYWS